MPVDLDRPLAWTNATGDAAAMLEALQPNILKEHVRDILFALLLRFDDQHGARALLAHIAEIMKSAKAHLTEAQTFNSGGPPGTPYVGVGLSYAGYRALGIADEHIPDDPAFRRGALAEETLRQLGDPPVPEWGVAYREPVHAIVMIGDGEGREDAARARRDEITSQLGEAVTLVGEEIGRGRKNEHGQGMEHFGYVDGRSQPLFLNEEIEKERQRTDGITVWDPGFPLRQVLVPEAGADASRFGSYLVLRKLEQDVRRFKTAEARFAQELGLPDEDEERAGALLIGRFEDGTPVTLQRAEGARAPVMNDFGYASDSEGLKCPLNAHIRLVNARGSDRDHIMPRRGQIYGTRSEEEWEDPEQMPSGGVGLLFMAFNADIRVQFEYTQATLANAGGDPIIGQGKRGSPHIAPVWGEHPTTPTDPSPHAVTLRGAAYFFAPSLPFLRELGGATSA